MPQRLMTPSKVTAWLDCPHYLTLRSRVDDGLLADPGQTFGSFARLLADKGIQHETECLHQYRTQGKSILEVPQRDPSEPFEAWVDRIGNPLDGQWDVIYQMPLMCDGVGGIADFLVRVEDPDSGLVSYEPVDAKLARKEGKPGHVLQLCFYADAIEALTGIRPKQIHLWLGSGSLEALQTNDFGPYWRRLQQQLTAALEAGPAVDSVAERCPHCEFCEFTAVCEQQWRDEDSLQYVAGIRKWDRTALVEAGVVTLEQFAGVQGQFAGLRPDRLTRLVGQAALQVQARLNPGVPPPFRMIDPGEDPVWGRGMEQLPRPDDGDVFLDFEGHPFWRPETGLFFLFGLLEQDDDGEWTYRKWWAHDLDEEAVAVADLIDYLAKRRLAYPGMHVYHYNHTERSSLQALTATHGVAEVELAHQIETGLYVDLFMVARNAIQAGTESYGLKHLEQLTGFERGHAIDKGAGAVLEYERFMAERDGARLASIAAYNEDDVRATKALRDWLIERRPAELPWREAVLTLDPDFPVPDERVTALHAFGIDTPEHLLGDILGYWTREWCAYIAPKMAKATKDTDDLFDDPEVIAGLRPVGLIAKSGRQRQSRYRFSFPPQSLDAFNKPKQQVLFVLADGSRAFAPLEPLDPDSGELNLVWDEDKYTSDHLPNTVVLHEWISSAIKQKALGEFAGQVIDGPQTAPNPVTLALLRRDLPRFHDGGEPGNGTFTDNLGDMCRWVTQLDHSFVAIQGPPGAGKTYSASHLIHALISSGKRVGITATSHAAISNLLSATLKTFDTKGDRDLLNPVYNQGADTSPKIPGVAYGKNQLCAQPQFNLVAGTTWAFASQELRDARVDVLVIDEAGQLSLADAMAASLAAHNLVLLGDPLQLAQVSQALHDNGSGSSVLDHILGQEPTMPPDRGVFLSQSWRMHSDICDFISAEIYQRRLSSHESCKQQTTVEGTGLRWLRAHHAGNSTKSIEEADLIATEIGRLIGTPWTDQKGNEQPLTATDFMVVAPFNDQRKTIEERLKADPRIAAVPVGTVDKFQGQEAAVVFFSMATSSAEFMTRGPDFLFSRNRLNVAISRARALAYLVCTEELLATRANNIDDMRLIATANAFVEYVHHKTTQIL